MNENKPVESPKEKIVRINLPPKPLRAPILRLPTVSACGQQPPPKKETPVARETVVINIPQKPGVIEMEALEFPDAYLYAGGYERSPEFLYGSPASRAQKTSAKMAIVQAVEIWKNKGFWGRLWVRFLRFLRSRHPDAPPISPPPAS